MSETTDRVDKIIVEHLGCDQAKVQPDASLIDDLLADSLDIVELTMAFENGFGIGISDDETDSVHLVRDCHDLVTRKLEAKQAA